MNNTEKGDDRILRLRLQTCLQTILELKEELDTPDDPAFGMFLAGELGSLEEFIALLPKITVSEIDVRRVELATAEFLAGLHPPLQKDSMAHMPDRMQ